MLSCLSGTRAPRLWLGAGRRRSLTATASKYHDAGGSEGGLKMQSRVPWLVVGMLSLLLPRLAGAQNSAGSISVQGQDVSFEPAVNYPVGTYPQSVAVGDFDGDGIQDLAVANGPSNNVSVLLGNGDGTFEAAQDFEAGSLPVYIAVGDFNGDDVQDLAVANQGTPPKYEDQGDVSVLLGNGDGSFQPALDFDAGFSPHSVRVDDFNGDGV